MKMGKASTYVRLHEIDARVNIVHQVPKVGVLDKAAGSRAIEAAGGSVEIGVVMKLGANLVGKFLELLLIRQMAVAL